MLLQYMSAEVLLYLQRNPQSVKIICECLCNVLDHLLPIHSPQTSIGSEVSVGLQGKTEILQSVRQA